DLIRNFGFDLELSRVEEERRHSQSELAVKTVPNSARDDTGPGAQRCAIGPEHSYACRLGPDLRHLKTAVDLDPCPRGGLAELLVELAAIDDRNAFLACTERKRPPTRGHHHAPCRAVHDQVCGNLEQIRQ